jgi:hypothetical protein
MFSAVLLLLYAIAVGSAGLGHPAGGGVFWAADWRPEEQVVREERPEVTNRRRGVLVGELDFKRRGMNTWVKTWVDVTFIE